MKTAEKTHKLLTRKAPAWNQTQNLLVVTMVTIAPLTQINSIEFNNFISSRNRKAK